MATCSTHQCCDMHSQQWERESSLDKYVRLDQQRKNEAGIQDHEVRVRICHLLAPARCACMKVLNAG